MGTPAPTSHTLGREDGFTLVELMMTAAILSVVLLAILALLDTSARMAPKDQERGEVLREAQVGLHRMTRELRQAYLVSSATPTSMGADVYTNAGTQRVTYDCGVVHPQESTLRRCVRTAGTTSEVVVDRIASASFAYEGTPTKFTSIKIVVPARGSLREGHTHDIVLNDGFYMRNRDATE